MFLPGPFGSLTLDPLLGQFACSSKHCQDRENLESWEVNFAYVEQGERKNTCEVETVSLVLSKTELYHHK